MPLEPQPGSLIASGNCCLLAVVLVKVCPVDIQLTSKRHEKKKKGNICNLGKKIKMLPHGFLYFY